MEEDERIARSRRLRDGARLAADPITALAILRIVGDPGRIRTDIWRVAAAHLSYSATGSCWEGVPVLPRSSPGSQPGALLLS
jgi:hypothetical protein